MVQHQLEFLSFVPQRYYNLLLLNFSSKWLCFKFSSEIFQLLRKKKQTRIKSYTELPLEFQMPIQLIIQFEKSLSHIRIQFPFIKNNQFYFINARQLRKFKLKQHPPVTNSGQILNQVLQFRNFTKKTKAGIISDLKKRQQIENRDDHSDDSQQEQEEIDDEIQSEVLQDDEMKIEITSNLERLSFDYSVCHSFDELPLNSDYFSKIRSISYNGQNKHCHAKSQNKQSEGKEEKRLPIITFNSMYPYSLCNLRTLKLKYCNINSKGFSNLKYMDCLENIQVLNFKGSFLDLKEFKFLLISTKLKNLKYLNLSKTNIDDLFCTTISDRAVVSFDLEEIDVSKTKV